MKELRLVWSVAASAFAESARNRFFTIFVIFALAAIYASVLAGVMAVDQEARVLADFGLALMELTALAYSLFYAATVLVKEGETKVIYLVFSRPVPRRAYLAGKLLGAMLTVALMLAVMAAMHLALLAMRGFGVPAGYGWALLGSFLKLAVITSVALFVSLFSTSTVSAMVISAVIWTAGHFTAETRFLAGKAQGVPAAALKALSWLIPNFQLFNLRDTAAPSLPPAAFFSAACWIAAAYLASLALVSRKEF
jgi:ABC-type transport system involved in multi-copper enzyme maturation permease subunit